MFQTNKVTRVPTKQDASSECQAGEKDEEEEVHLAQKNREGNWFRKVLMAGAR